MSLRADTPSFIHSSKSLRAKFYAKLSIKKHFYSDSRAHIDNPILRDFYQNSTNTTKVGIIGGGIGGSALALALLNNNIPCVLFEKDSHFSSRKQGYGLTIQQGISALRKLGFQSLPGVKSITHTSYNSKGDVLGSYGHGVSRHSERKQFGPIKSHSDSSTSNSNSNSHDESSSMNSSNYEDNSYINDNHLYTNEDNSISNSLFLSEYGKEDIDISTAGRHNIHIPRQTLRQLLLSKIPHSNILWGHQLKSYIDNTTTTTNDNSSLSHEGSVTLEFMNGLKYSCSVLVAADGIYSTITKTKFPSLSLRYLNLIVILGISKNTNEGCIGRIRQWLDGSTRVFSMPYNATHTMWQLSYPCEEEIAIQIASNSSVLKSEAVKRCMDWPVDLTELLRATEEGLVSGHPVYDRTPLSPLEIRDPSNAHSHITFLGDSLHPMSPFKGQGANQALLDSLLLANALRNSQLVHSSRRPISTALAMYEEEACRRSSIKVLRSRAAASSLHSLAALSFGNMTRASVADGYLNESYYDEIR